MDPLIFARLQFAITTVYHFFFVPLTLGLSVILAIMETIYVITNQEIYKQMTKFWGKLFLINFAMGVVTGIVLEFQFGMNWSEYSRFVGDVFGAPLAIEALLAFFLESTFLGVWIFGWDRLSKGIHAATIWLVAIGANVSAFWILAANSFMQQPMGYAIQNGRAVMIDFMSLVTNPNLWVQFPHTVLAGFTTAAFFVMGISAYHLKRSLNTAAYQDSFKIAAIFGAISVILLGLVGHTQAQHMVEIQPMKMAAAEALWQKEDPASFSLLTIGDLSQRRELFSIRIPRLLSLLAYNRLEGEVKGIYNLQEEYNQTYGPGDYIPPVAIVYWSFRFMVAAGLIMLVLVFLALSVVKRGTEKTHSKVYQVFTWAIALPYIGSTAGWILTEVGRTPWVVFGLMKIDEGVSTTVPGITVLTSLIIFTLVYGALMIADVYLLRKYAKAGIFETPDQTLDIYSEDNLSLVGAED